MASTKTRLIRSHEVKTAIDLMLRSWASKVTASMGARAIARDVLEGAVQSYTMDRWDGVIPEWSGGDTGREQVGRKNLYAGVMTLENALKCVDDAALDAVTRFELMSQPKPSAKPLRWRKWAATGIGKRVMAKERLMVRAVLEARTLRKRRRVGRQRISTAVRRDIPVGQFVFGGRKAVRMPQGRPALPREDWLARYFARKNRRQQKNATTIKRNRGLPRVPETKLERPLVVEKLGP